MKSAYTHIKQQNIAENSQNYLDLEVILVDDLSNVRVAKWCRNCEDVPYNARNNFVFPYRLR